MTKSPKPRNNKKWVWYSDKNSRNGQVVSILAIVETFIFVILTWFLAAKYEAYHLIIAISIAPLLLLKTRKSIDRGLNYFFSETVNIHEKNLYADISLYISAGIVFFASWIISYLYMLLNPNSWGLSYWLLIEIPVSLVLINLLIAMGDHLYNIFLGSLASKNIIYSFIHQRITLFGIFSIIGAVGAVLIARNFFDNIEEATLLIVLFLVGLSALGYFISAIVCKVQATVQCFFENPIKTLISMPDNFREQILVNDIFYTPELLPEIGEHNVMFTLSGVFNAFKNKVGIRKMLFIPLLLLWSLSYFYRWSIKSTAWFYFPLVYLSNVKKIHDIDAEERRIIDQGWKAQLIFNAIVLIIVLINFNIIESFSYYKISLPIVQIKLFLNNSIHPWSLWLIIASIVLYFFIYLFVSLREHRKRSNVLKQNNLLNKFIHWIIRVKFTLWYVFFICNVVFFWKKYDIWNVIF